MEASPPLAGQCSGGLESKGQLLIPLWLSRQHQRHHQLVWAPVSLPMCAITREIPGILGLNGAHPLFQRL